MYELIAEKIYLIEGENRGRYPYANSLLIDDSVKMLIDTGMGPNRAKQVAQDYSIDMVLISHGHEDHIPGNQYFEDARICTHHLDAAAVRSVDRLLELFGVMGTELQQPAAQFLQTLFQLRDSRVDLEFNDGHRFKLGSHELEVVHTPGHSAGHCSFYITTAGIIFLADLDLSSFGPLYGYLDSDIDSFIKSIEKVKKFDFDIAISSHKEVFRGRHNILDRLDRYKEKIFEREAKLLHFLQKNRTLEDIVDEALIYGQFPEPREMFMLMEKTMISKHLDRLVNGGQIMVTEDYYRAFKT